MTIDNRVGNSIPRRSLVHLAQFETSLQQTGHGAVQIFFFNLALTHGIGQRLVGIAAFQVRP